MRSGTKYPALYRCTEGAQRLEAVVKFREALWRQSFSLVAERVASLLARDLGLESAEIVVVEVDPAMAEEVAASGFPEDARQIRRSAGRNMGSLFLGPGFRAALPGEAEMAHLRPLLTRIVAFDFLIQNFDRKLSNPNMLRREDQVVLIDHEQAFGFLEQTEAEPFAAEKLSLSPFLEHIFFPAVDLAADVAPLFERFAALAPGILQSYFKGMPAEWLDDRSARLEYYLLWAQSQTDALQARFLSLFFA